MNYGKYKRVVVEKKDGTLIPDAEPVFVLRAQDVLAPIAVEFYAMLQDMAIGIVGRGAEIRSFAAKMRDWPHRRLPD